MPRPILSNYILGFWISCGMVTFFLFIHSDEFRFLQLSNSMSSNQLLIHHFKISFNFFHTSAKFFNYIFHQNPCLSTWSIKWCSEKSVENRHWTKTMPPNSIPKIQLMNVKFIEAFDARIFFHNSNSESSYECSSAQPSNSTQFLTIKSRNERKKKMISWQLMWLKQKEPWKGHCQWKTFTYRRQWIFQL